MVWLLGAGLAYLAPTLSRGTALGDYELLSDFGFGVIPNTPLHNVVSSDQIQEMIPWTNLSWLQVHHGHLPMWNPFVGLGMPLAFNFSSAPFSLTTAVGYLFPLHLAYTVMVVAKLLVAGTGALFLARVAGVGLVSATFAGTVFELSGAFTAWLGWPQTGVFCWLGWILGATLLVIRGRHPARDSALLAVFVALAVLGGHPESVAISLTCWAVFAVVVLGRRWAVDRRTRQAARTSAGLLGGVVAGFGLSAPLLLPGLQLAARSSRTAPGGYTALPHTSVVDLATSTFYGLPVLHHTSFGPGQYYRATVYVGIGALTLVVVALVLCWRRAETLALGVVGLVCILIVYSGTVAKILGALPGSDLILWDRAQIPLDLVLAVLAGVGLQALSDRSGERIARYSFVTATAVAGVVLLGLFASTRSGQFHAGAQARHERLASLVMPSVQVVAGLLAGLLLARRRPARHRPALRRSAATARHWRVGTALLVVGGAEIAFLLTATPDLWSSSPHGFTTTPAERAYQSAVGADRVGFGACPSMYQQPGLGILAEANSAFGVRQFAAFDPMIPQAWFQAWGAAVGKPSLAANSNFCASVDSVSLARQFGVGDILVPPNVPAPAGAVEVTRIEGVGIYRVPGAGVVTAGPVSAPADAPETVLTNSSAEPSTFRVDVDAPAPQAVRFHVSDLPGWDATVDGRAAPVRTWAKAMMEVTVGPGHHVVVLRYRPAAWTAGLWIALATAAVLALTVLFERHRSRALRPRDDQLRPGPPVPGRTAH